MQRRRVEQRGSPQLRAALAAGHITLHRADEIAKLSLHQQESAVDQWSNRSQHQIQAHALAARAIRQELRKTKVDLDGVLCSISAAVGLEDSQESPSSAPNN